MFGEDIRRGIIKMNDIEINEFIEQMQEIGDEWTVEQVKDVYGDRSLEEALQDRKSSVGMFMDNIAKIINR